MKSRYNTARKILIFWTLFIGVGAVGGATACSSTRAERPSAWRRCCLILKHCRLPTSCFHSAIVFVKILPETKAVLGNDAEKGYPYDGAKEHYIIDPDDTEIFNEIISVLRRVIPLPKKRGK